MSMKRTCPISNFESENGSGGMRLTLVFLRRVFGSVDRSAADRTSDRAGAAQESAVRFEPVLHRTVLRAVFVEQRWHGRAPPSALPPGPGSQAEWAPTPHL